AAGATLRPEVIGQAWNRLRAAHGLPADHDFGRLHDDLVLSPFPSRFRGPEYPLPQTALSFRRDLPDEHQSELPSWWPRDPDLSIIYVTLGTVFPLESGDLFERILPGLGPLQAGVVTTVGPDLDPAALGPQPDHVHV
ncbi:MAG TPA: glycosyltransferase, partial [Propionibacteriaceae bacterium]|nr:glycosyltransferase [Propionibacteriaceae bacterium]